MNNSIWIREARLRKLNGAWCEWELMQPHQTTTAYGSKPPIKTADPNVFQRRAVEYKRVEPETLND